MAISVNREGNPDGSIDLTINISTTQFFNEYWEKAIKDTNVKIADINLYQLYKRDLTNKQN